MGAVDFATMARAKTAADAFRQAVDDALYESGHGGYTGTIAEKNGYQLTTIPDGVEPRTYCRWVEDVACGESLAKVVPEDHRAQVKRDARVYSVKYGPALCAKLDDGKADEDKEPAWLFFGVAAY